MKHNRIQKRLYSLPEAAEYLGRSEWSIRRLVWSGKLPQVRCGKRVHVDIQDMDQLSRVTKYPMLAVWVHSRHSTFWPSRRNSRFSALLTSPQLLGHQACSVTPTNSFR